MADVEATDNPTRTPGRRITAGDAIAGMSIALVLIPQSLAYAQLAGLPPYVGLYAAALPPLAAAFFASSPYLQTGPTAVTSVLTAGALSAVAVQGTGEYVLLASLLAVVVGVIRIAIGLFRGGRIVYLMSEPVLRGFTAGAAVLIVASQIPGAVGLEDPGGRGPIGRAVAALLQVRSWTPEAVILSLGTFVVVRGARRVHPLVPGALVATLAGLAFSVLAGYPGPVLGTVPQGLPPISLDLPWTTLPSLLLGGAVLALVGFSEVTAIARMYAARERQHWDPDRDFISQGVANLAAGIGGGFPVGGSFSRSSLGHLLGTRTRWSSAVTGIAVLAFLPFASLLSPLPIAVLSGMVMAAATGLLRVRPILSLWSLSRPQFLVSTATLVLTLVLTPHIEQAVLLGIAFSVVVHLWREFNVEVEEWTEGDTLHVRPRGVLWFGSAEVVRTEVVERVADHPSAERLVLHVGRLGRIDLTAALALRSVLESAEAAGLAAEVVDIHPETAPALRAVMEGQDLPAEDAEPATV